MAKIFGKPQSEPPNTWTEHPFYGTIKDAGGGLYYAIVDSGVEVNGKGTNVWVWHWHKPTKGAHRWALSGCGLHDIKQVEPLTLDPSLACEDGCPSHGYLIDGVWAPC